MKKMLEKYGHMIDLLEKEYDYGEGRYSYWCYLKAGYEYDGCQTIHEDTLKEIKEILDSIK